MFFYCRPTNFGIAMNCDSSGMALGLYQKSIRANDCYLFNQNSTNHPRATLLRNHTLKGYVRYTSFKNAVLGAFLAAAI